MWHARYHRDQFLHEDIVGSMGTHDESIDTDREWSKHSSDVSDGSGRCHIRCDIACSLSANA